MNTQVKQILKLNKKFYQFVFEDFSKSRNSNWDGWDRSIKFILNNRDSFPKNLKILDLGCGNGRFINFISKKINIFEYKGYDTNNDLLSEAKRKYKNITNKKIKLMKKDIIKQLSTIKTKYDLVVCFGVTHHLPDNNFRIKWFSGLSNLCNKNGLVVFTLWNFTDRPGDYLLGWGNTGAVRYCHKYSTREIAEIKMVFTKQGYELVDKYKADNKNNYLVFGRI